MAKKTNYKKKAIELAKKIVRDRNVTCEWCGKIAKPMHGAHIMSVRFAATAADTDNIMALCYYCHFRRWHSNPIESVEWFKAKWPGRYERLLEKARPITKYKESDWQEIYETLRHL